MQIKTMWVLFISIFWIMPALADKSETKSFTPQQQAQILQRVAYQPVLPPTNTCVPEGGVTSAEVFAWQVFAYMNQPMLHDQIVNIDTFQPISKNDFWTMAPFWQFPENALAPRWAMMINQTQIATAKAPFINFAAKWQCSEETCLTTNAPVNGADGKPMKVFDIYGQPVFYEQRFNPAWMYSTINFEKDIAAGVQNLFNMGKCRGDVNIPAVMSKIAWRLLQPNEDKSRFITMKQGNKTWGIVGMHIAAKTSNHWEWIWSTFEQVNNFEGYEFNGKQIPAGFNALQQEPICVQDQCATVLKPYQPSKQTSVINDIVTPGFAAQKSPLAYYRLLGTQHKLPDGLSIKEYKDSDSAAINIERCKQAIADHKPFYVTTDNRYIFTLSYQKCDQVAEIINPFLYNPILEPTHHKAPEDNLSCIGCHVTATFTLPSGEKRSSDLSFAPQSFFATKTGDKK